MLKFFESVKNEVEKLKQAETNLANEKKKVLYVISEGLHLIKVYPNKIEIIRKYVLRQETAKTIYFDHISAIEVQKPGLLRRGYIQVVLNGSNEMRGNRKELIYDENSLIIQKQESYNLGLKLKSTVEKYKYQPPTEMPRNTQSIADELAKLKELLDQKAITSQEYETLKSKLIQG